MRPPCSNWNMWIGAEIEGHTDIGTKTLFIRSAPDAIAQMPPEKLTRDGTCKRLWICKEFRKWWLLKKIMVHFDILCVECTPGTLEQIPRVVRERAQVYMKVSTVLRDGDHICVGPAFSDESFRIGDGAKVTPDLYLNDKKIL